MASDVKAHLIPATLGAATGIASYLVLTLWPDLLRVPLSPSGTAGVNPAPGLLFGAVIAWIAYRADPRPVAAIVALLGTLIAWGLAYEAAANLSIYLEAERQANFNLVIGGIAGGLIGGFVTAAGVAATNARMRSPGRLALVTALATHEGLLLTVGGPQLEGPLWIMFALWQATVAAAISCCIAPDRR